MSLTVDLLDTILQFFFISAVYVHGIVSQTQLLLHDKFVNMRSLVNTCINKPNREK